MHRRIVAVSRVMAIIASAAGALGPQTAAAQAPRAPIARPTASAARASEAPRIDGILDERVWQDAEALGNFVQADPAEGEPATERTEVRLLYDDGNLYVGVICYDNDPSQIIVTDARRDTGMNDMDSFQVIFDTYRDRQNGFVFGTNPSGAQFDAQVRNEGEVQSNAPPSLSGASSGSGGGVNVNWDASWEVRARITEIGWVAEFRIPLRSLRYGAPPQAWGLNFTRLIRRKRETVYWSPVSRAYNVYRLSSAGDLGGLDLKTPRNFKVSPYVIGSANRPFTSAASKTDFGRDWGVDVKYGITPSLNADLTYNTDFAQVEADQQQINLTRFNLVFPEKRPFFLENAGLFAVGKGGDVDLFYSRRIGISADGSLVPIKGGVRISGKAGGVNVGALNMQTEAVGKTPSNNFTALRVNRELPNRSRLGVIFTNRAGSGANAASNDWGRTAGVDAKWGIGEAVTFNGFAARTQTPGKTGSQHAFSGGVEYNTRTRRDFVEYTEVGDAFDPQVGFLQRTGGYRQLWGGWFEHVRTDGLRSAGFRELYPHMTFQRYWNYERGTLLSSTIHSDVHFDWENGFFYSPAFNVDWDGLDREFEVYPGVKVPPGVYMAPHTAWQFRTDRRKPIFGTLDWNYGGFLSGRQNSMGSALNLRHGSALIAALNWTHNDIDLPQGHFKTNLGNLRVTYNFSPFVYLQSLVQYNDRTNRWSTNLRFSWLDAASTGLFLVYNDTEGLNGLGPINRSFIVKFSRQVDVLH